MLNLCRGEEGLQRTPNAICRLVRNKICVCRQMARIVILGISRLALNLDSEVNFKNVLRRSADSVRMTFSEVC